MASRDSEPPHRHCQRPIDAGAQDEPIPTPDPLMTQADDQSPTIAELDDTLEQLSSRGEEIREAQLEQALDRLDEMGGLTTSQRSAVEQLSYRLVEQLLAVPEASLREAITAGETETAETALELFEAD